jgi:hypothetical protein
MSNEIPQVLVVVAREVADSIVFLGARMYYVAFSVRESGEIDAIFLRIERL